MDIKKLKKALGKKRMAKVADIIVAESYVDILLTNGDINAWDFWDFTDSEIIFYAKQFIDDGGHFLRE